MIYCIRCMSWVQILLCNQSKFLFFIFYYFFIFYFLIFILIPKNIFLKFIIGFVTKGKLALLQSQFLWLDPQVLPTDHGGIFYQLHINNNCLRILLHNS